MAAVARIRCYCCRYPSPSCSLDSQLDSSDWGGADMSHTEHRWVGTCEICGGEVLQQWMTSPAIGNAGPVEQPIGAATCSVDPQHDWRGLTAR